MRFSGFLDIGDKAVAMAGDRHDVPMVARRFAQDLSKGGDIPIEIAFLDDGVAPDALHQLFLEENLTLALDQQQQDFEGFWRQRYGFAATQKKTFAGIDAKGAELVTMLDAVNFGSFRKFSEVLHRRPRRALSILLPTPVGERCGRPNFAGRSGNGDKPKEGTPCDRKPDFCSPCCSGEP